LKILESAVLRRPRVRRPLIRGVLALCAAAMMFSMSLSIPAHSPSSHEAHSLSAAAADLFVNSAAGDYHLKDGSPAEDRGETLAAVPFDKEGKPRPVGNASDIGAYEHGTPVPPDTTPPAAIADLEITNVTITSVTLNWTSPGDNGTEGTARSYELRRSNADITVANWKSATKVAGAPVPLPAGKRQGCNVSGLLPDNIYYFAIRATDGHNNTAPISNVAWNRTLRLVPDRRKAPWRGPFSTSRPRCTPSTCPGKRP